MVDRFPSYKGIFGPSFLLVESLFYKCMFLGISFPMSTYGMYIFREKVHPQMWSLQL